MYIYKLKKKKNHCLAMVLLEQNHKKISTNFMYFKINFFLIYKYVLININALILFSSHKKNEYLSLDSIVLHNYLLYKKK